MNYHVLRVPVNQRDVAGMKNIPDILLELDAFHAHGYTLMGACERKVHKEGESGREGEWGKNLET